MWLLFIHWIFKQTLSRGRSQTPKKNVNFLTVCVPVTLADVLPAISSLLLVLSPKSFAAASSVHRIFKYEVIVFVIPNVWVCRKGMISRHQQLCVQSSRTPVSLPKVFSDPTDPWRILQQRAKNTIYSDYTFKMRGTRLETQCSTCLRAFAAVIASKFTGKIRSDVERQEASSRGIQAVNVWFLWFCREDYTTA